MAIQPPLAKRTSITLEKLANSLVGLDPDIAALDNFNEPPRVEFAVTRWDLEQARGLGAFLDIFKIDHDPIVGLASHQEFEDRIDPLGIRLFPWRHSGIAYGLAALDDRFRAPGCVAPPRRFAGRAAKMAPASSTRTFDQVGRVNRSAKPTSRDRNRSGSGDPGELGRR